MWIALLLAGCETEPTATEPASTPPPVVPTVELIRPTDPYAALVVEYEDLTGDAPLDLTLGTPGGEELTLVGVAEEPWRVFYRPEPRWEVGEYIITGGLGGAQVRPRTFTITGYGVGPDFDAPQVGDAWSLDLTGSGVAFLHPPGIGGLLLSQLGDIELVLEIMQVEEQQVTYRIVAIEDDFACSAHTSEATLDADGRLTWASDLLTFPVADEQGAAHQVTLDFGLLDDGLGAGQAWGELDTAAVGLLIGNGEDSLCELLSQFGVFCHACPDGAETCLDIEVQGVTGQPVTVPWEAGANLGPCAGPSGDEPVFDVPPIDCSGFGEGCSSSPWGASWLGALVLAVLFRRR